MKNDALRWVGVLQVLKIFRSKIINSEVEKYSFASALIFWLGRFENILKTIDDA